MPITITDPSDERLRDFVGLTDVRMRRLLEPAGGLYLAESEKVIRRALATGHEPRAFLMGERWLTDLADIVEEAEAKGVPVYTGTAEVIEGITGYNLHCGALASMHRPQLPSLAEVLDGARRVLVIEDVVDHTNVECSKMRLADPDPQVSTRSRIAVLEDLVDHTNVGACFRSAAAMGLDAVLVTPRCADPLYRRSIRVSMGTVFQVPWTRIEPWPSGIELLKDAGYVVAGMTLAEDAITLDELAAQDHPRLALVFGTEGEGLSKRTSATADVRVRIPMMGGVDSLNVAASSAVAFYATR